MRLGLEAVLGRRLLLEGLVFSPFQADENPGVTIPIFPVFVALVGIVALLMVGVGALRGRGLRRPRPVREPRALRPRPPSLPTVVAETAPGPVVAPVYKKAPVSIAFPMIKPGYPDVWGVNERATVSVKVEDRALLGAKDVPGLTATVGAEKAGLQFFRGEARVERTFPTPRDVTIVVELRVKGEMQPRRTTRVLRIVDYREEIADLFAQFKEEMSANVTPLRADATAWEIYDALLDANPGLSQVALREVVSSFEEAKFSNHPVGRPTYEKMVHALKALKKPAEA